MRLRLRLIGPVRLTGPEGNDRTPTGRKACGMLALLGTAPDLRMPRSQVQDRLWSQSPPAQGAASLRQAIRELRQALGDGLLAGNGWIGLDPAAVAVDLRPMTGPTGQPVEFAEGLDIRDPEFEDWLRDMRFSLEDRAPEPDVPLLVLTEPKGDSPSAQLLAGCVLEEASARAAALLPTRVVQAADCLTGLRIESLAVARPDNCALLLMVLRNHKTGAQLWAQHYSLSPLEASLRRVSACVTLTLIQAARQLMPGSEALYPHEDLFSFTRSRLLSADHRLKRFDGPVPQALRAFLRYTLIIERQAPDAREAFGEAEDLSRQACAMAPGDPIVLSIAALMKSWKGEVSAALDLARLACRVAPGHDLAHLALSQALTDAGRDGDAFAAVARVGFGPIAALGQPSWRLRMAVAQIRLGRLADAEESAAIALSHAPDCRPALRILAALRFKRGDVAGAAAAIETLRQVEPDFSLPLMASPDYPVTTLRRAGLLDVTRSGL